MALDAVGPKEFGQRLAHVRRTATATATGLSLDLHQNRGFVSWLEKGTGPKGVDLEHAREIAVKLAGTGNLVEDDRIVFEFLIGLRNDPRDVVRSHLRLVEDEPAALESTTAAKDGSPIPGWTPLPLAPTPIERKAA